MELRLPSARRVRFIAVAVLCLSLNLRGAVADVAVVVSVSNPVATLTRYEVIDIFLGRANRFPNGSKVVAIDQHAGTTAREAFYTGVVGVTAAQLKSYWSKIIFTGKGQPLEHVSDDSAVKKFLNDNPDAIGYIERSLLDDSVKEVLLQ
jgi:ABC-type phosphate transport system substrate-binding protein